MALILEYSRALKRPPRREFLPYFKPWIGAEEVNEVTAVLKSGWLTTGERARRLEEALKSVVRAEHVLAVSSCTAGLHLSLDILGIGPGDEVVTTPFTFCSTVNVILHCGAKPVFVDIAEDLTLDARRLEKAITKKTRAVIPVHFGGYPADMDEFLRLARKHRFVVVEDAAHALGATYHGKPIGSFGHIACFSFYANKNITTGEGGAVATSNSRWAKLIAVRRLHGMSETAWDRYGQKGAWQYDVEYPGYKYNLSDLQAAVGIHQVARLAQFQARRKQMAEFYRASFAGFPGIRIPPCNAPGRESAWHLFQIHLDLKKLTLGRDEFVEALRAENIGANVHYLPVHLFSYYRKTFGFRKGMFPVAEAAADSIVSLPIYPAMTDEDSEDVVGTVARVLARGLK